MSNHNLAILIKQQDGSGLAYYLPGFRQQTTSLTQRVTIGADLANPTLSWMYNLMNMPAGSVFDVSLSANNGPGGAIQTTSLFSTTQLTGNWKHQWQDLSPWSGQTVTLTLQAQTPAGTQFVRARIDEVSLGSSMPDLDLTSAGGGSLLPGETGVCTYTYSNPGSLPAPGAVVTITLPTELRFAGSGPEAGMRSYTWQLGTLAPQQSGQIRIAVSPDRPIAALRKAVITAVLGAPALEPNLVNNTRQITIWLGKAQIFLPLFKR